MNTIMDVHKLEMLRPLGKMEQFSSARHHLGFYNNVGLSVHYKIPKTSTMSDLHHLVYSAAADVISKHPILSAIPIDEDTANPYFARLPSIDLARCIIFVTRSLAISNDNHEMDEELDTILEKQHNINFRSEYGTLPFWRLVIVQTLEVENEFTACYIFHHALGDGASGLVFHKTFLAALNNATASLPLMATTIVTSPTTPLLPPLEELHSLPIPAVPNKATATTALKEWTGKPITLPSKSCFKSLTIPPEASQHFIQQCKQNKVTVTSALPALIATIFFKKLPKTTEALTCVIPVSLRRWLPLDITNDAMGTWIDAFSVKFVRPEGNSDISTGLTIEAPAEAKMKAEVQKQEDIWTQAAHAKNAIKTYLSDNGNAINVARFKNIPNMSSIFSSTVGKARDSAFEVSNLGVLEPYTSTILGWEVGRVVFSRSAFASGSALSVGVVSGSDGSMTLGFTWQEGVVMREVVESVMNGVKAGIEAHT